MTGFAWLCRADGLSGVVARRAQYRPHIIPFGVIGVLFVGTSWTFSPPMTAVRSPAVETGGSTGAGRAASVNTPVSPPASGPSGVHKGTEKPESAYDVGTIALTLCVAAWHLQSGRSAVALQAAEKGKADATEAAPAKKKKPRIDAYEACRFILIFYIASGHFIATATKNPLILKLVSQINVLVGGFFALSGYLAAYTTTELGVLRPPKCEDRLDNAVKFVVPRVLGFWMLHVFVLLLFSPMFFWVDATYSGPLVALWHGFISVFMLQSWFPLSAEVWNAPTWFLSALSFAFMVLPYGLRILAGQKKSELRRTLVILTLLSLIPKIGYSYDLRGAWGIMEGVMSARSHPNYALFNNVRFSPFAALGEVLMGAAACRLVMLDTDEEKATGSALIPLAAMVGLVVARALGLVSMNDMIVRALVFIPLFLVFLMRLHRTSVGPGGADNPLVKILNNRVLQWLGGISFPIFIVHGPIGQVFYKKAVATKLFGGSLARYGPGMFGVWWIVVIAFSWLLNEFYVKSDTVKKASANLGNAICARLL